MTKSLNKIELQQEGAQADKTDDAKFRWSWNSKVHLFQHLSGPFLIQVDSGHPGVTYRDYNP